MIKTMRPAIPSELVRIRPRDVRRKLVNSFMLGLTGLATLLALVPLFWIIYSVVSKGLPALTPAFFTQTFAPTDVGGGGES